MALLKWLGAALAAAGVAVGASAAEAVPEWVSKAAAAPVTVATDGADAVVLLHDETFEVAKDGGYTSRVRSVLRVLTADGRGSAVAQAPYTAGADKVQVLRAWHLPQNGTPRSFGKKDVVDVSLFSQALNLYSEARRQQISPGAQTVGPGDVFAFESVVQQRSIFSQRIWPVGRGLPVQRTSYAVTVPAGWQVGARVFNHAAVEPVRSGATTTWSFAEIPASEDEAFSPGRAAYLPWLALDLQLPPAEAAKLQQLGAMSWGEWSKYFTGHYDRASEVDAAMQARAEAAVAGLTTRWERAAALARVAQQVNYISIQLDAARAGGMIPRPATQVSRVNYGDCKDKATFLRALLRSQGIKAHPAVVYIGDRDHVREEWPSPFQFNHCILAIEVDDSVAVPAAVDHPQLGRLVLFDPTDEYSPPGLLRSGHLATHALLLAGEQGGLITLPNSETPADRLERRVTAKIDRSGAVRGTIVEDFHGLASNVVRKEHRTRSATDYQRLIQGWLARTLSTPTATRVAATEDPTAPRLSLEIDFEAPQYAKPMRDVLLVFKPVVVARRQHPLLRGKERRLPMQIDSHRFKETSELELPEGFRVDELPPVVDLETSFGRYRAKTWVEDGRVRVERALELQRCTLPPERAAEVKSFFDAVLRAEQTPVVLERVQA